MSDFQPGDLVEVIAKPMVHGEQGRLETFEVGWGGCPPSIGERCTVSSPVDFDGDVWLWTHENESIPMDPARLELVEDLGTRLRTRPAEDVLGDALASNDWRVRRWAFRYLEQTD